MTAIAEPIVSPIVALIDAAVPKGIRSLREFVEEEFVLPDGPRKGDHFDGEFPAWQGRLLELMADDGWQESWVTGPRQTGKTLLGFEAPLLYHLFEVKEDVICLLPEMAKASMIWRKKIEPVIRHSRFADELPTTGKGSRGGDFALITFANGASLIFMGAGGADPPSSATARVVIITEANEIRPSEVGDQGNPVDAVRECTSSFPNPRIYGESIITTEDCITWQQITKTGTDSKVLLRCPSCGTYQFPERGRFKGWEDAKSPIEAGELAGYHCAGCELVWHEAERAKAMERAEIIHAGQTIDQKGKITGEPPRNRTLGVRYNAMCHPLRSMSDIAEREWNARKLGTEAAEMAICQYTWAIPYTPKLTSERLDHRSLALKSQQMTYHRGEVPSWVKLLTVTSDVQKGRHYWMAMGHGFERRWSIIDWGQEYLHPSGEYRDEYEPTPADRVRVMDKIAVMARTGWPRQGNPGEHVPAAGCGIDTGWHADEIYPWVFSQPDWAACKGVGATQDGRRDVARPEGSSIMPEGLNDLMRGLLDVTEPKGSAIQLWHVFGSTVRQQLHSGLLRVPDSAASGLIPKDLLSSESLLLHLTSEIWTQDPQTAKWYWRLVRKNNHLLDCAVYGLALGWYLMALQEAMEQEAAARKPSQQQAKPRANPHPQEAASRDFRPLQTPDGRPYNLSGR